MPLLRAWLAARRKRDPFAALDAGADNPLFKRYSAENRALLRIARGDIDDGLAGIRAVSGVDQSGIDTRINAARLLAGSGYVAQAHALLAGNDPEVAAVAAGFGKGTKPSFGLGVSPLFTRLAGGPALGDPCPLLRACIPSALWALPGHQRPRGERKD